MAIESPTAKLRKPLAYIIQIKRCGILAWKAFDLGPRSGFCLAPALPKNQQEAEVSLDYGFIDTRRVFMANRGIWDAVASAGPQASFVHEEDDIDSYLRVAAAFLDEVVS